MKWSTVFIISFALSAILLKSFSQSAFFVPVSPWLFGYPIKEYPVFYYIVLAFLSGLSIGLFTAIYNYLTLKPKLIKKSSRVKHLEKEIGLINSDLEDAENKIIEKNSEKDSEIKSLKLEVKNKESEIAKITEMLNKTPNTDVQDIELDGL